MGLIAYTHVWHTWTMLALFEHACNVSGTDMGRPGWHRSIGLRCPLHARMPELARKEWSLFKDLYTRT